MKQENKETFNIKDAALPTATEMLPNAPDKADVVVIFAR